MLVRLMYASRAAANLDNEEVTAILRHSRATNAREGLTGALCLCNSGRLFKVSRNNLEGGAPRGEPGVRPARPSGSPAATR